MGKVRLLLNEAYHMQGIVAAFYPLDCGVWAIKERVLTWADVPKGGQPA
jgi:hypothetical protein